MSLEEANKIVNLSIQYYATGWEWQISTLTPFGFINGYKRYPTADEAVEELKQFLRYFTKDVLKNGDTIRKYVEKHKPKKEE